MIRKNMTMSLAGVGLVLIVMIAGCTQTSPDETREPTDPPVAIPDPPYAAISARQMLSDEEGLPLEQITIVSHERHEWSDSCLGLGGPAEICAQVTTPGWQIELKAEGQTYRYRADQNGDVIRREG
ncbi:MAG: hypothetical protein JXJ17_14585 [Anaerolineae bacterium]|nr:hypothetical protein [Anaerolineae bacterium]